MIFVTVGTTYFDELIREVDRLAGTGAISGNVLAQIGQGQYVPSNIEWVRYLRDMRPSLEKAELTICHGGVTVFELLLMHRPFLAVPNRALPGDHQTGMLRALEARGWCACCYDVANLGEALKNMPKCKPYPCDARLARTIWSDLSGPAGNPGGEGAI